MADERKTQVTYQGNGTQRVYSFPFDYLRKAFVKVRLVDNETRKELVQGTEYTVTNKQITLASPTNLKIEIVRQTTTQPLVAWKDASVLKAVDMSVQEVQLLHLAEETRDEVRDGGMALSEAAQAWDARMHRIINVLDPKKPTDAVTLHYITATKTSLLNELQTKGTEQVTTITQTGNTYVNRLNALKKAAETAATTAEGSNKQAASHKTASQSWAIGTVSPDGQADAESPTGKTQSSRSWALIAKDLWSQCVSMLNEVKTHMQTTINKAREAATSAQQAKTSQTAAQQQATVATTQAAQATQAAQDAAQSAQNAATWNPAAYDNRQVSEQKYLQKTGGSMTGAITATTRSSFVNGRDRAALQITRQKSADYCPVMSVKTPQGSWEIGAYDDEKLLFIYVTDSDYAALNYQKTTRFCLSPNGHIVFPNGAEMWIE